MFEIWINFVEKAARFLWGVHLINHLQFSQKKNFQNFLTGLVTNLQQKIPNLTFLWRAMIYNRFENVLVTIRPEKEEEREQTHKRGKEEILSLAYSPTILFIVLFIV